MSAQRWMSKKEIAAHRGISTSTIERLMKTGLPYTKRFPQSHPRFWPPAVDEWMDAPRPDRASCATASERPDPRSSGYRTRVSVTIYVDVRKPFLSAVPAASRASASS